MIEADAPIVNRLGLHARAAAKLVHAASEFVADIKSPCESEAGDAQSMLGVPLLAAPQGMTIRIRCAGSDEVQALDTLRSLIANRFGEDE